MFLTCYRDTDNYLLRFIDELSLKNLCIAIPHLWFYKDENFWQNRMKQNFPNYQKTDNRSWKRSYLTLLYYTIIQSRKHPSVNHKMCLAAKLGNKDAVSYFISKGANLFSSGMYYAVKGGHLDLVIFFENKINYRKRDFAEGLFFAARYNNQQLIDYFIEKGAHINSGLLGAIKSINFTLIKRFINMGAYNFDLGLYGSIKRGSLKLVKFFADKCSKEKIEYALDYAMRIKKHESIIKYLEKKTKEMWIDFINERISF